MTTQDNQPQQPAAKPQPGTPEYNAAMAALYDNQGGAKPDNNTQNFVPTRPEWIEEQFWDATKGAVDAEKLAKSYGELRKKMSAEGVPAQKTQQAGTNQQGDQDPAAKAVASAGLDFNKLGESIATKGDIDATDYEALEKVGIPKAEAENYIRLIKADAERVRQDAFKIVGGEEVFNEIMAKAKTDLTPDEKKAFNEQLRIEGSRKAALETLKNRFISPDREPQGQINNATPSGGQGGYASLAEQTAAINDPKYKVDPAYRAQVRQKIAVSKF